MAKFQRYVRIDAAARRRRNRVKYEENRSHLENRLNAKKPPSPVKEDTVPLWPGELMKHVKPTKHVNKAPRSSTEPVEMMHYVNTSKHVEGATRPNTEPDPEVIEVISTNVQRMEIIRSADRTEEKKKRKEKKGEESVPQQRIKSTGTLRRRSARQKATRSENAEDDGSEILLVTSTYYDPKTAKFM